jgi:hypothetical protein
MAMKLSNRLTLLFIGLCLAWAFLFSRCHGQAIVITGPLGTPPNELVFVSWEQLAGHTATLEYSEDMVTWRPLGTYSPAASTDWHTNLLPVWAGSYFFRTVQTLIVPAAFAMWPEDAFR